MMQDRSTVGRWATSARREARRDHILDTVLALLEEHGYEGTSMQKVAKAARTSKETLYAWFGDKAGLFEALVAREAEAMNTELTQALEREGAAREPRDVLNRFGVNVLRLLLGARSLSINRAAIAAANTSPELGRILAAKGRETTRPLVERYLNAQHDAARLNVPDVGEAFEVLMGLLVRDLQIRTLLGVAQPLRGRALESRAEAAVEAFLRLYG
jgi:AcrR family transcriptional regulator